MYVVHMGHVDPLTDTVKLLLTAKVTMRRNPSVFSLIWPHGDNIFQSYYG